MISPTLHSFYIPVMGLGFTIDTPIKVAPFGISSVMSIVDDIMIEQMRQFYCHKESIPFTPIMEDEPDFRAKRICAYLNVVKELIDTNIERIRSQSFEKGSEIATYFELLPDGCTVKQNYLKMLQTEDAAEKKALQKALRNEIVPGAADVNIMAKVDKNNFGKSGEPLPTEFSDALSALRGFALSNLSSSVVFSAGYNPRLYNYIDSFPCFLPDSGGNLGKTIILKVSDYRSALTQGKILAKKGVWVSEYRIESGLNCGGHAFATDGLLLGPILEEFKQNRKQLEAEVFALCNQSLSAKGLPTFKQQPALRITVQGGIGTANEDNFLRTYYQTEATGWGSPFLLVPEVTAVDERTLKCLSVAQPEDYYLSNISPLGVPFNSFRGASSEVQRTQRIYDNRPGSPCTKKYLVSNTEFSESPICTASRKYQALKLKQLYAETLPDEKIEEELAKITDKDCLCEGLSIAPLLKNGLEPLFSNGSKAVCICPGPNLAYFSGVFTLRQMVDHIYGRTNLLNAVKRPNLFINELKMYVDYLKKDIEKCRVGITTAKSRQLKTFQQNLLKGIAYYHGLTNYFVTETKAYIEAMRTQLDEFEALVAGMAIPTEAPKAVLA